MELALEWEESQRKVHRWITFGWGPIKISSFDVDKHDFLRFCFCDREILLQKSGHNI